MLDNTYMPAIRPGEPITHFLYRVLPYIPPEIWKLLVKTINGHSGATRPVWMRPRNLDGVAKILGRQWDGSLLRKKHSLAPLLNIFLDEKQSEEFLIMVVSGKVPPNYSTARTVHGTMSWGFAYCFQCVKEAGIGVPMVKRTHLLSGLSICHRHGEELLTYCRVCTRLHAQTLSKLLMRDRCSCGQPMRSRFNGLTDDEREKDMQLGRIARSLLDNDMSVPLSRKLAITMHKRASDLGLIPWRTTGGRVLREYLFDTLGPSFIDRHGLDISDKGVVYTKLFHGEPVQHPISGLGLILAMFGPEFSLEKLKESEMSNPPSIADREPQDPNSGVLVNGTVTYCGVTYSAEGFTSECRARLAAKMAEYPGALRSDVLGRLNVIVQKWLKYRDTDYLDALLPARQPVRQGNPKGFLTHEEDASLAAHMRKQHVVLWERQKKRQFRVSAWLLVGGHPQAKKLRWEYSNIPLAREARAELEETTSQFNRRILGMRWVESGRFWGEEAAMETIKELTDAEVVVALKAVTEIIRYQARSGQ